jgi:hypothetical protein
MKMFPRKRPWLLECLANLPKYPPINVSFILKAGKAWIDNMRSAQMLPFFLLNVLVADRRER